MPLTALTLLTTASAVLAWALTRGWVTHAAWPFHRPAAWLLTWWAGSDFLRAALDAIVLHHADRPYTGFSRVLFHIDQAVVLSWPAALLATTLVVYLRGPWWPAAGLWAAGCAAAVLAYPELRLQPLGWAYAGFWSLCWMGAVAAVALERVLKKGVLLAPHIVLLFLLFGEPVVVVAGLSRGEPEADWSPARASYVVTATVIILYQAYQCWHYRRGNGVDY